MKINVLFSCITFNVPQHAQDVLQARGVEWLVLNSRNGRDLVDMIGDRNDLQWVKQRLTAAGLDPKLIMAWRPDTGAQIKNVTLDLASYLDVAPDNPDGSRPTSYAQTHAWAGWAAQLNTQES